MHPRWQELCDSLPARIGARFESSETLKRAFGRWLGRGRHVRTTNVGWFLALVLLSSFRRRRRATLRYAKENARIESWLAEISRVAPDDYQLALELARCQNLLKGYGETHDRSLRKFDAVMAAHRRLRGNKDAAETIGALREAAARDEDGVALREAVAAMG
jgi:indolepyruvate ferredoxin oxidoreductase beta subunit